MAIINRPRLRNVLVGREIADEPAAVEIAEVFAEEVESSQADFVTQEEQNREVSRLEAVVELAVERIEAKMDHEVERIHTELKLQRAENIAEHRETRARSAESHLRTVGLILGGLALATAILAIVIAVT